MMKGAIDTWPFHDCNQAEEYKSSADVLQDEIQDADCNHIDDIDVIRKRIFHADWWRLADSHSFSFIFNLCVVRGGSNNAGNEASMQIRDDCSRLARE